MFWRKKREDDLERELRSHLDAETEEQGDRFAAARAFGNVTRVKEDTRGAWGWTWIETLGQDLRFSARTLRKSPGFAAVAIVSLALGIGASTAIFTVVNGVLLRPLPYPEPEGLVRVWESSPTRGISRNVVNGWNFLDWRERTRSLEAIAAIQEIPANLTGQGEPVTLPGMQVSAAFFSVLRVPPLMGRTLTLEEEIPGKNQSVVLSYRLWQSRFGGDPAILGKRIVINGGPSAVVGVMPAEFSFPNSRADIWIPLPIDRSQRWAVGRSLSTVARLKPGVTLSQASDDLARVAGQMAQERPGTLQGWSAEVVPFLQDTTASVRTALLVLMGAVSFLLAIACANVANLFLMRGAERFREAALREALGASRMRVFRQYVTESLLISLLAAAIGLAAGTFGMRGMLSLLPPSAALPRAESISLDARVFTLALAASVLTAILFGLVPLVQTGRLDLQNMLRLRSRTASKGFRYVFVTAQIALALVLLAGAGLMTRSFSRLVSIDPGFRAGRLLALDLFTSPVRFSEGRTRSEYYENLLSAVRTVGVETASSIQFLPLEQRLSKSCFAPPVDPPPPLAAQPSAQFAVVGPGYFTTMGIPLLEGREFTERDRVGSASTILVNRAFVRRYYPNESPLGKRLNVCWSIPNPAEIVGVVGDARQAELRAAPEPTIVVSNLQAPGFFATIVVRSREEPAQITRAVVAAIHQVNGDQAVSGIRTMDEVINNSVARPRFQFLLLAIFAGVALLLAAIGVYGVVSYSVAQRKREIGVRLAVGASRSHIAELVLKEGLVLSAFGVITGLAGAVAVTRFLKTLLYEVTPTDPLVLAAVCGILAGVAAVAIAVPLQRATRVDPMTALRNE